MNNSSFTVFSELSETKLMKNFSSNCYPVFFKNLESDIIIKIGIEAEVDS